MRLQLSYALMRCAGQVAVVVFLGIMLFNGVIMLMSPSVWFRLPRFVSFRGTLWRDLRPRAQVEIRAIGLLLATVVVSMLVSIIRKVPPPPPMGTPVGERGFVYTALCLAVCISVGTCGILMLLRPRWWIEKYFTQRGATWQRGRTFELTVRLLSLLLVVPAIYFALSCLGVLIH